MGELPWSNAALTIFALEAQRHMEWVDIRSWAMIAAYAEGQAIERNADMVHEQDVYMAMRRHYTQELLQV